MSDRYPGGLIRKTPPTVTGPTDGEGGSAPGIWTLEQVAYYIKEGTWPKKVLPRELYTWGIGTSGRLGHNDLVYRSSPTQVGSLATWSQISVGGSISTAIKTDGTLWAWGDNALGQLGQNNTVAVSSPIQVGALNTWSQVDARSGNHVAAIKTDGTLWSWGLNNLGQLGHNNLTTVSSPVQVGSLTTWYQVSAGQRYTVAIKTDGTLWAWGDNGVGRLGINISQAVDVSSPVQVGALTTWAQVSASDSSFTSAIKTDGTLWAWGSNSSGQLGQNDTIHRSSPVQVGALTNWAQVSLGQVNFVAIKTDGTIWTWGGGGTGKLGQNDTINRSSPVQVGALTTWSKASAGIGHVTAIKTDGTLWVWGSDQGGKLGLDQPETNKSSPVQVGSLTTWYQTSAGSVHTAGITKG